jgi:hypothetical protein
MVIFLTTNNFLLPSQIEFTCIIHCYLPPLHEGKNKCMNSGWGFTFSENHWSTLETTKQFIHKIFAILANSSLPLRIARKLRDSVVVRLLVYA